MLKYCSVYLVNLTLLIFTPCSNKIGAEQSCRAYINFTPLGLSYKLVNNGSSIIIIPESFRVNKEKDSLLLDSYVKSKIIDYNQFKIPLMRTLPVDSTVSGILRNVVVKSGKKYTFFVRVYDMLLKDYIKNSNSPIITEQDFVEYEKMHSHLIAAHIR
jgi:hypothetical protein